MSHQGTETPREPVPGTDDQIGSQIVDAAFEVHSHVGPGLLESVYESCFAHELSLRSIPFEQQLVSPITYKGLVAPSALRLDFLVANRVVVELKAVESLVAVHTAQLLSYLKLRDLRLGYLINFNVSIIKHGIKRMAL